jgi:hypothetical protein
MIHQVTLMMRVITTVISGLHVAAANTVAPVVPAELLKISKPNPNKKTPNHLTEIN